MTHRKLLMLTAALAFIALPATAGSGTSVGVSAGSGTTAGVGIGTGTGADIGTGTGLSGTATTDTDAGVTTGTVTGNTAFGADGTTFGTDSVFDEDIRSALGSANFGQIDSNADGQLSQNEFSSSTSMSTVLGSDTGLFTRLDVNSDGFISETEFDLAASGTGTMNR